MSTATISTATGLKTVGVVVFCAAGFLLISKTRVSLVKNNVHTNDESIGVGWLPVCTEGRARQR